MEPNGFTTVVPIFIRLSFALAGPLSKGYSDIRRNIGCSYLSPDLTPRGFLHEGG